ncbi:hypothetical protein [Endozoicomonas arenosclerae]|uniref:hypothetical protein n=1 Tax=Endozoicomonas arenosclerae TaxID=1633495 RepID=UPI0007858905|nr:hypothetical protein [Endozoicomonas arenosclerae]
MDYVKYCNINNFKPDGSTLKALDKIERKTKLSTTLKAAVSTVPIYKIFVEPSPKHSEVQSIITYDWIEFEKTIRSIDMTKRVIIGKIAQMEAINTHDFNNRQFWKCVSNATR